MTLISLALHSSGVWFTILRVVFCCFLVENDEELFEDNPEEYIRRDLEGGDSHTRRKSACVLVHALCEAFEGSVITNFATYINHLLAQYASAVAEAGNNGREIPSAGWGPKDSALLLVTSLASREKTETVCSFFCFIYKSNFRLYD